MQETLEEKYALLRRDVQECRGCDPVEIACELMKKPYVGMHGPEHHFLDGAAFLAAYKNAGGKIDLDRALYELAGRTIRMPGAMCGQWGICGSVASVGAALAVIHQTGPLSTDRYYKDHMAYASSVIAKMSEIGGARCCKRNVFLSLSFGARFVRETYGIPMQTGDIVCTFSDRNAQCLVSRCPFHAHTGADD